MIIASWALPTEVTTLSKSVLLLYLCAGVEGIKRKGKQWIGSKTNPSKNSIFLKLIDKANALKLRNL